MTQEKHIAEIKQLKEAINATANEDHNANDTFAAQVNQDLCEQLSREFANELTKANVRHAEEIATIKELHERQLKQERLTNMPL